MDPTRHLIIKIFIIVVVSLIFIVPYCKKEHTEIKQNEKEHTELKPELEYPRLKMYGSGTEYTLLNIVVDTKTGKEYLVIIRNNCVAVTKLE